MRCRLNGSTSTAELRRRIQERCSLTKTDVSAVLDALSHVPGIISEAMGHSSITVTETYLKPFRSKKIDEANKQVLDFVKRSVIGVNA